LVLKLLRSSLQEDDLFVTTRCSCLHGTKYTSYALRCQVFIFISSTITMKQKYIFS